MNRPDIQQLISDYERAIASQSLPLWHDAADMLDIIEWYEMRQQDFEAEYAMRQALLMHPEDPHILLHKAVRLKQAGKWSEAMAIIDALPIQDDIDVLFVRAEKAMSELHYEEASQLFTTILQLSSDAVDDIGQPLPQSDILLDAGQYFIDYGSPLYAIEYLRRIQPQDAEYAKAQMEIAEAYFEMGNADAAITTLDHLLDAQPYTIEAWTQLAEIAFDVRRYDKSAEAADYALAIDGNDQKALRIRAFVAIENAQYDKAVQLYTTYAALYPDDYTLAISIGEVFYIQKDLERAQHTLEIAHRCCPNDNPDKVRILTLLAAIMADKGDLSAAHQCLLGTCSLGIKYSEVAVQMFSIALEHDAYRYADNYITHYFRQNIKDTDPDFVKRILDLIVSKQCLAQLPELVKMLKL